MTLDHTKKLEEEIEHGENLIRSMVTRLEHEDLTEKFQHMRAAIEDINKTLDNLGNHDIKMKIIDLSERKADKYDINSINLQLETIHLTTDYMSKRMRDIDAHIKIHSEEIAGCRGRFAELDKQTEDIRYVRGLVSDQHSQHKYLQSKVDQIKRDYEARSLSKSLQSSKQKTRAHAGSVGDEGQNFGDNTGKNSL